MNESTFNVVVPTRERADTLVSTLRALVEIDYARLKIIVCDNASTDNTRDVVSDFNDKRIHYSRSKDRLSIAQNWQRGLALLDEGYVTYLGDDDALLIGAIPQLNTLLNELGTKAIAWDKIEYPWPNCTIEAIRGRLRIPLSNRYEILSGDAIRKSVKKMEIRYTKLPCLYNSFVDVGLVKSLNKAKPFYCQGALSPDVYAAIALSYHVGDYVYSRRPFSINGASAHSIGASGFYSKDKSAVNMALSEFTGQTDARLIVGPSMVIAVALEFWNVCKHFGYEDCNLDLKEIVSKTKAELHRLNGERYSNVYSLLKKILEKNRLPLTIMDGLPASVPEVITNPTMGFDSARNILTFDSRKIGVRNVYDAAKVAELLLPGIESLKRKQSSIRKARRTLKKFRAFLKRIPVKSRIGR
jgi:glycosyltransferase involved in cell wall biosynthesis